MKTRRLTSNLVLGLYFLSGLSALILEVTWAKELRVLLGSSTFAVSAVVTSFMLGLGIGAAAFGRWTTKQRRRWIKIYGFVEALIGIYALLFPFLVRMASPLYAAAYASYETDYATLTVIRFAISATLLFLPTFLMGGTFPMITQGLSDSGSPQISKIYFVNLLGAGTGAVLAGFILLPSIGIRFTAFFAALIYFLISTAVFRGVIVDFREVTRSKPVEPQRLPRPFGSIASLTAFIQGLCAFIAQIAWTRVFAQMFGSSAYTFSLMLAVLLFSLAAAALTVHFWRKKGIAQAPTAGWTQTLFGVSILATLPVWEWLLYFFARNYALIKDFWFLYFGMQVLMAFAAIGLPCFCMGLVLPSIFEGRTSSKPGLWGGTIYAWNTFGAVLGASIAALFLLLRFGAFTSLKITAAVSITAGLIWILFLSRSAKTIVRAAVLLPVAFAAFLYPLNKPLFAAGIFYYGTAYEPVAKLGKGILDKIIEGKELVFYKDGISSTVSVLKSGLNLSGKMFYNYALRINGKTDASIFDAQTQLGMGYLSLSARSSAQNALVIGLGSGMTLSTLLTSEQMRRVDCIEIEPAVVEAQRFFVEANRNALADPRVHLIIGDGRNHVRYSRKTYDIIISEPSNPWIAGVSSLYTKEAFEEIKQRLRPSGVYCQWFHSYNIATEEFSSIITTFRSVFPHANLFQLGQGDFVLLGSNRPLTFDTTVIKALSYLRGFILSDADLTQWSVSHASYIQTDDRLELEYKAPKALLRATTQANIHSVHTVLRREKLPRVTQSLPDEIAAQIYSRNGLAAYEAENYPEAISNLSLSLDKQKDGHQLEKLARAYVYAGYSDMALQIYDKIQGTSVQDRVSWLKGEAVILDHFRSNGYSYEDARRLASFYFLLDEKEKSIFWLRKIMDSPDARAEDFENAAKQSLLARDAAAAMRYIEKAKKLEPDRSWTEAESAIFLVKQKSELEKILEDGKIYLIAKAYPKAKEAFQHVLAKDVGNAEAKRLLAVSESHL